MNVLSLFAGIGGLDLGLERAGMTVVGQVEIDPFCRRVLAAHWPEVPRHDDVRTAPGWWLGEPRPAVDVVAGGFPCQPVSTAGRRLAQDDPRWLWPATWAVIRDIRPRYAILENVPGLFVRGLGDVLGDLAAGGYDARWDCVSAASVGAPHLRERVFIVASLNQPSGRVPDAERDVVRVERERVGQQHGEPGPAVVGDDGPGGPVADPDRQGRGGLTQFPARRNAVRRGGAVRPHADRRGADVADPAGVNGQGGVTSGDRGGRPEPPARMRGAGVADADRIGLDRRRGALVGDAEHPHNVGAGTPWRPPTRDAWWSSEPDVGRVAHGIPARVDRLRGLGNAVVPQVAEHIGRLVMERAS